MTTPFTLAAGHGPIIVEVPHAGLEIPSDVALRPEVSPEVVLRDADAYVDLLADAAPSLGASLLVAKLSRYVVDLNRAEDDIDGTVVTGHPAPRPRSSRGVVWRTTTTGHPVLPRAMTYEEFKSRIDRYHRPYHTTLEAEVARLRKLHARVLVLSLHSMPSVSGGVRRADTVPGSLGRTSTSEPIVRAVETTLRAAGLSVVHDDPYRGGATTQRYARVRDGIHALQLEFNRALYVDEATSTPRPDGMNSLRRVVNELITTLGTALR